MVHGVPQPILPSDLSDIKKYVEAVNKNVSKLILNVTCLEVSAKAIIVNDHSFQQENSSTQLLHASVAPVAEIKTFTATVFSSLGETIKSAIEHTMQKLKAKERGNVTITIRNLGKYGSDADDVNDLFNCLRCRAHVINMVRIGRPDKSSTKFCLLKIELSSVVEKTGLLRAAEYLKDDAFSAHKMILQWFLPEKLLLRATQKQCRALNDKANLIKDGRKHYIVVRGKLMKRINNGSLRPVQPGNSVPKRKLSLQSAATCSSSLSSRKRKSSGSSNVPKN